MTVKRDNANILSNRIVVDMSEKISLLLPSKYPLTVLTKKIGNRPCNNYKFEWMEDDLMGRWTAINNAGAAYDETTTDIVVDDETIIAVGDVIKSVATGEIMKVTDITAASHTLTVARGYGETEAAAGSVANDVKLLVVGNASMQGSGAPAEKHNNPSAVYNYTQIFKTPFSVTNTLDKTKLYGGAELARLRNKKAIEHGESIELALWFGERKLDLTTEHPTSLTGGVMSFISGTDNVVTKAKATVTEADYDAWIEDLFRYGSGTKIQFASASIITLVNSWAKANDIVIKPGEKMYGIQVMEYLSPHGTLKMVKHPLFVQGYEGYSFALDMENIDYRPLAGRDTKLMTNIQNNDEDGIKDQYLTETGLEIRQPKTHGAFIITF